MAVAFHNIICYGMTILERRTHFLLQTWGSFRGVSTVIVLTAMVVLIVRIQNEVSYGNSGHCIQPKSLRLFTQHKFILHSLFV